VGQTVTVERSELSATLNVEPLVQLSPASALQGRSAGDEEKGKGKEKEKEKPGRIRFSELDSSETPVPDVTEGEAKDNDSDEHRLDSLA
jgi:hypothetical protein